LSSAFELVICGVREEDDIPKCGALAPLVHLVADADPAWFTLPSVTLRKVDDGDIGSGRGARVASAEQRRWRIVPVKISASKMHADQNWLGGDFVTALSVFQCDLAVLHLWANTDICAHLKRLRVMDCGLESLSSLAPLCNFKTLEVLDLIGPLPKMACTRLVCAAMFPTLRTLNGSRITEKERRATAALLPVLPRMDETMRHKGDDQPSNPKGELRDASPDVSGSTPAHQNGLESLENEEERSKTANDPLIDIEAAEQWVVALERELRLFRGDVEVG